ncbi:MAG: hypothetical protein ACTSR0_07315 [Candidatus Asgardarchaeia archaeon]
MSLPRKFPEFSNPVATRKILLYLLEDPNNKITPCYDRTYLLRYKELEEVAKASPSGVMNALKELLEERWLDSKIEGNIVSCPKCGSLTLMVHYVCPNCSSQRISSVNVIKHLKCGFTGMLSDFLEEEELVCPNCSEPLTQNKIGIDWIAPGKWFYCYDCKNYSGKIKTVLECLKCGNSFAYNEGKILSVYSYFLNPGAFNLVAEYTGIFQDFIVELAEKGYEVQYPASIKGSGPIPHNFTFFVSKEGKFSCVIDVYYLQSGKLDERHVLQFASKAIDVKATHKLIVAIPSADEKAYDTAVSFKIDIIEASNIKEAIERITRYLRRIERRRSREFLVREEGLLEDILRRL